MVDPNDDSQFQKIDATKAPTLSAQEQASAQMSGEAMEGAVHQQEDAFKAQFADKAKPAPVVDAEAINVATQNGTETPEQIAAAKKLAEEVDADTGLSFDGLLEQDDKAELEAFNAKYKTNFGTLEEAMAKLSGSTAEAKGVIDEDLRVSKFYADRLSLNDNGALVLEDLKREAYNNGQDLTNPEVIEDLNNRVEAYKDANTLDFVARSIRSNYENEKAKADSRINSHQATTKQTEAEKAQAKEEKLRSALINISKEKDFYGLQLKQENLTEAYKKVAKGDFLEQITSDNELAVELYLLYQNREEIKKKVGSATYGNGVEDTFKQLRGTDPKAGVNRAKALEGVGDHDNYINSWTK